MPEPPKGLTVVGAAGLARQALKRLKEMREMKVELKTASFADAFKGAFDDDLNPAS